ncbi:4-coumarate--CoA ligase 1-like isoform X6 [Pomacea canaliculata]|uniref:4-coumarate--CoA ligase 1-like isoform X6 n=1 Tax=Pomacea canaliculata TaxID=400727 RepID=UPI000D73F233|nr:4-coumarate--CoA ligase 1-like isoform X6 [Pomacea canaliculata]
MEKSDQEIIFSGPAIDSSPYEQPFWPFLKRKMESYGDSTALVNPYTREEISFRDLVVKVERLARGLLKLGLGQGRTLTIVSPNNVENAMAVVATIAIGAVVHAPNPASVPGELRRQMVLCDTCLVLTVPELLTAVKEAVAELNIPVIIIGPRDGNLNFLDVLDLGTGDVSLSPPRDPATTLASLLFSSGTTGLPKGVEITQRNIMAFIHFSKYHDEDILTQNDTILLLLPLFHVYGQVVLLMTALAYGCRQVIMNKFEMVPFLTFIGRYKVTRLFLVPPIIVGMVSFPNLSQYDLSSVQIVVSGAAPLGKETEEQFCKKLHLKALIQGYGLTECMVAVISKQNDTRPGSVGRLLPNTKAKIVDPETGRSLGVNQRGELYLHGPQMTRGYLKNPEATRQLIDDQGWLHTGDVAIIDSDGFIYIVDRLKELIKYKGEQVAPAVLEDLLLGHLAIADACVIGMPDPVAGELPRAYVVPMSGVKVTEREVQDFVAKNTPSYMHLRGGVEFRDHIPKSPSGKILRRLLRDELTERLKSRL